MRHFDEEVSDEMREIRSAYISKRWSQLYQVSTEAGETAIKYLFNTNAGGAVAVLTYLGAIKPAESLASTAIKISLALFFLGVVFVGIYRAHAVHYLTGVFNNYQDAVDSYYNQKFGWSELSANDERKVGNPIFPYILGYLSFGSFVFGCIVGVSGFFNVCI